MLLVQLRSRILRIIVFINVSFFGTLKRYFRLFTNNCLLVTCCLVTDWWLKYLDLDSLSHMWEGLGRGRHHLSRYNYKPSDSCNIVCKQTDCVNKKNTYNEIFYSKEEKRFFFEFVFILKAISELCFIQMH